MLVIQMMMVIGDSEYAEAILTYYMYAATGTRFLLVLCKAGMFACKCKLPYSFICSILLIIYIGSNPLPQR